MLASAVALLFAALRMLLKRRGAMLARRQSPNYQRMRRRIRAVNIVQWIAISASVRAAVGSVNDSAQSGSPYAALSGSELSQGGGTDPAATTCRNVRQSRFRGFSCALAGWAYPQFGAERPLNRFVGA